MESFYGFLEEYELIGSEEYYLRFDIIPTKQLEFIIENSKNLLVLEELEEASSFLLELNLKKDELMKFATFKERQLVLGNGTEYILDKKV